MTMVSSDSFDRAMEESGRWVIDWKCKNLFKKYGRATYAAHAFIKRLSRDRYLSLSEIEKICEVVFKKMNTTFTNTIRSRIASQYRYGCLRGRCILSCIVTYPNLLVRFGRLIDKEDENRKRGKKDNMFELKILNFILNKGDIIARDENGKYYTDLW
jgi:hypothetical protein